MPPGTGDVALTMMQNFPLEGIVMVSVPQDMVSMIVAKAINMCKRLNVEVLGLVENMSYMQCPHCDEKIRVFDSDDIAGFIKEHDVELLAELPINGGLTQKNRLTAEVEVIFDDIAEKVLSKIALKK
jgi:Mrp family chromosome partitioning ATPase